MDARDPTQIRFLRSTASSVTLQFSLSDIYDNPLTTLSTCSYFPSQHRLIHHLTLRSPHDKSPIPNYSLSQSFSGNTLSLDLTYEEGIEAEVAYAVVDGMVVREGFEVAFYLGSVEESGVLRG